MARALAPIPLVIVGLSSCGEAGHRAASGADGSSHAASAKDTATAKGSEDSKDSDSDAAAPDDDGEVLNYGHAAGAEDARAVAALVRRYYVAAAAGDGGRACAMLSSAVAEGVSEEYEEASGRDLHGHACALAMAQRFTPRHRELVANLATLRVTSVRVEERMGLAVLRIARISEPRKIAVRFEGGHWKVRDLLDSGMP